MTQLAICYCLGLRYCSSAGPSRHSDIWVAGAVGMATAQLLVTQMHLQAVGIGDKQQTPSTSYRISWLGEKGITNHESYEAYVMYISWMCKCFIICIWYKWCKYTGISLKPSARHCERHAFLPTRFHWSSLCDQLQFRPKCLQLQGAAAVIPRCSTNQLVARNEVLTIN